MKTLTAFTIEEALSSPGPVNQEEKLIDKRKDALKSISDVRYGQDMRRAQKDKDHPKVQNLRKKIKNAEGVKKNISTQLKSMVKKRNPATPKPTAKIG